MFKKYLLLLLAFSVIFTSQLFAEEIVSANLSSVSINEPLAVSPAAVSENLTPSVSISLPVIMPTPDNKPTVNPVSTNVKYAPDFKAGINPSEIFSLSRSKFQADQINRVPGMVQVITAAQIKKISAVNLKDVLVYLGGFYSLDTVGNELAGQIGCRGANQGNQALLIVDGIILNDGLDNQPRWLYFSADSIARIEIFSPVISYSLGYAKVVYVYTKNPRQDNPSYNIGLSGGNREQANARLSIQGLQLGSQLNTSWFLNQSVAQTGREHNSLYRQNTLTGKTTFLSGENFNLSWAMHYSSIQQEYPGDLSEDELETDRTQATTEHSGAKNYFLGNSLLWENKVNSNLIYKGQAYATKKIEDEWITLRAQNWQVQQWYNEEASVGLLNQLLWPNTKIGQFTLGIDLSHQDSLLKKYNTQDSDRKGKISNLFLPQDKQALYLEDHLTWLENGDFVLGVRSEAQKAEIRESKGSGINSSGSEAEARLHYVGLSYLLLNQWQFFGNFSQGFNSEPYARYLNQNLKTTGVQRSELGIKYNSSETFLSKKTIMLKNPWRSSLVFYTQEYSDDLFWVEGNPLNEDSLRRGLDFSINGQILAQWNAFLNYNSVWARFSSGDNTGKAIPMVPEQQYSAGLTYFPWDKLSFTFMERYYAAQWAWNDQTNDLEQMSDYDLVDIRADYRIENFELFFSVNNLFDRKILISETYLTFPQGVYAIPGARRTWQLGLSYNF